MSLDFGWARDLADYQVRGFVVENKTTPAFNVEKIENKIALKVVQNGHVTLGAKYVSTIVRTSASAFSVFKCRTKRQVRMNSKTRADVVIAGTGIVGCLVAEQMLDAGPLGGDASERDRTSIADGSSRTIATCRPPQSSYFQTGTVPTRAMGRRTRQLTQAILEKDYLIHNWSRREGVSTDLCAICRRVYVALGRHAFGDWTLSEDMMIKSKFGRGAGLAIRLLQYSSLTTPGRKTRSVRQVRPIRRMQWPPIRSKPYMMEVFPYGSGQKRCAQAAESIGLRYIPCAQARNNKLAY